MFSIAIVIIVVVKSIVWANKEEASIAINTAETAFYNRKYDVAITGYTKIQEKEEQPIWNMKIAEIYCVKGNFVKSNEILVNCALESHFCYKELKNVILLVRRKYYVSN